VILAVCIGAMSEQTELKLELLQFCRVKGVELPGRVLEPTGEEDPDAYRESLQIAAEQLPDIGVNNVSLHLPYWPADISSLDAREREAGLATIARSLAGYAERFPGGIAVVHPGGLIREPASEPDRMAQSIDSLCRVAQMAAEMNVRLAIENMQAGLGPYAGMNMVGQDIAFLKTALREIASNHVGLCFDAGHANTVGDVPQMARQCGGDMLHLHLSDNPGNVDSHLPPGDGTVPWAELGDVLFELGYDGAAVLEIAVQQQRPYNEMIEDSRDHLVDWIW